MKRRIRERALFQKQEATAIDQQHRGTKVFVSYSRNDNEVADWLTDALKRQKASKDEVCIEVLIDKNERRSDLDQKKFGIHIFEDWWSRIEEMILSADTIVFLVTPDFVTSETCRREVLFASESNKKLAPIICKPTSIEAIPEDLCRVDWIDLTETAWNPEDAIRKILDGLRTDIDWIREHTRLTETAKRWSKSGEQRDLLLQGSEIVAAMSWSRYHPSRAPSIDPAVSDYIRRSEEDETRRAKIMRRFKISVGTLSVILVLAYAAWQNEEYLRERYFWFTCVRGYVLSQAAELELTAGEEFVDCAPTVSRIEGSCPEMIVVQQGTFVMGSDALGSRPNEQPPHRVEIGYTFAVSKFEVTADQWNVCVAVGGCPEAGGVGEQPINGVSWHDAVYYVNWLSKITGQNYRLLSEAEWEYIARSGTSSDHYWGDELGGGNANCKVCGSEWDNIEPAPVGSFAANELGFHDTLGNVWEWVADNWHADYHDNPPIDGYVWKGVDGNRVVRGGGWYDDPINMRVSGRFTHGLSPEFKSSALGFRVARELRQSSDVRRD